MTYSEFIAALDQGRAIRRHYDEIVKRFFEVKETAEPVTGGGRTPLHDLSALVGYLGLMLDENDKLVHFLLRLENERRLSRREFCDLMGLRDDYS
jgi:hypothetical protein